MFHLLMRGSRGVALAAAMAIGAPAAGITAPAPPPSPVQAPVPPGSETARLETIEDLSESLANDIL